MSSLLSYSSFTCICFVTVCIWWVWWLLWLWEGDLSLVRVLCARLCGCIMLWRVLMSGGVACCSVGVSRFSIMCSELLIMLEISWPLWSPVCEYQSVECAFTSPVSIESGVLYGWGTGYAGIKIRIPGDTEEASTSSKGHTQQYHRYALASKILPASLQKVFESVI